MNVYNLRHLIFRLIPRFVSESPRPAALIFAVSSTSTSCLAAWLEGRLFSAERGVWPFWSNISTLVDFLVLDPLTIYYITRSYNAVCQATQAKKIVHNWKNPLLLAVTAVATMASYVHSFLDGHILDATIIAPGVKGITVTGWVVFAWTTLFIYVLYQGLYIQLKYVTGILSLTSVSYEPFHEDRSGGLRVLVRPSLEFLKAMLMLFIIFVVFYYQDRVVYQFEESLRLDQGLIAYVVVALPLFLMPLFKVHWLMLKARDALAARLNKRFSEVLGALDRDSGANLKQAAEEMESVVIIRKHIDAFPTWPPQCGSQSSMDPI